MRTKVCWWNLCVQGLQNPAESLLFTEGPNSPYLKQPLSLEWQLLRNPLSGLRLRKMHLLQRPFLACPHVPFPLLFSLQALAECPRLANLFRPASCVPLTLASGEPL